LKNIFKAANRRLLPGKLFFTPKWIVLGVNNICNLHCKMCDVGTQNLESNFAQNLVGTHPINMPLDLIKLVIDQISLSFPSSQLAYAFTEPLLYPHLIESLDYANHKNLYTTVTTNALNLKHKADDLVKAGLNEIFISLDGPEEVHNKIRGHKSSFQRALAGMEAIKNHKNGPKITVICAITEWNVGHLKSFADALEGSGINELAIMHTQYTDAKMAHLHNQKWGDIYPATDSNLDEINLNNMDLVLLQEEIQLIRRADYTFKTYFSPEIDSLKDLEIFYHAPDKFMGKYCGAVFSSMMIKSDGSVIPAHGRCYNLDIGNMYQEELVSIWNSQVISKLRKQLMSEGGFFPACSRCCSAI